IRVRCGKDVPRHRVHRKVCDAFAPEVLRAKPGVVFPVDQACEPVFRTAEVDVVVGAVNLDTARFPAEPAAIDRIERVPFGIEDFYTSVRALADDEVSFRVDADAADNSFGGIDTGEWETGDGEVR